MRRVLTAGLMILGVAGFAWSQAMVEVGAAVAGGSIGGVAGKKVSDGITSVLQKVEKTAGKAAKTGKAPEAAVAKVKADKPSGGTMLQVGPGGVIKDHSLVPPPPPAKRAAVVPPPPPPPQTVVVIRQPMPMLPPPPQVTSEDLKTIASGTARVDVLKLGAPASRITMFDNGHLVEIYRYQTRETTLGVVRLSDGSVSSVQVQ